ncbi:replication factor A protein [Trifolium repens]|nr:replication factor A protein [Trifolium repens]
MTREVKSMLPKLVSCGLDSHHLNRPDRMQNNSAHDKVNSVKYVIGLMTGISAEREYVRDGKITKMVVIELTDSSGKCECALFGDYVDDLNKKMGKSSKGLPA